MSTSEILINFLVGTVFPTLTAIILTIVVPLITLKINAYLKEKTGNEYNIKLDTIAEKAINYVEEIALNKAKTVNKMSSNEKLDTAIKFIMSNCPKVSKEQAEKLALATLNRLR